MIKHQTKHTQNL